jgi:hypothetical protein
VYFHKNKNDIYKFLIVMVGRTYGIHAKVAKPRQQEGIWIRVCLLHFRDC